MNEEWLVYRRTSDKQIVAMVASSYDKWAKVTNQYERDRYPIIARGLTRQQAEKMEEMTKEPK
jgi:hypothetical protein